MTGEDERRVLVVFSDGSLGGTSRSAWMMGAAWRLAGAQVDFAPIEPVHPQRLAEFTSVGLMVDPAHVDIGRYHLVHLHHAQIGRRQRGLFLRWARQAAGPTPPCLLTHNVFAEAGLPLRRWPGPVAVGLLGEWAIGQFAAACWPHRIPPVVVVPNPQDLAFFRPPSPQEREGARRRLEIAAGVPVVLRVGSPLRDKWSDAYLPLARAAGRAGALLICAGAPPVLAAVLGREPAVRLLAPCADADWLRDLYWAADVLAVDARQGESFGNVIVEALGCGTPVVYRDRPTRDNTPREFPIVVSRGSRRWIRDVLDAAQRPDDVDRAAIQRYSVQGVARVLERLLTARLDARALAEVGRDAPPPRRADRIAIAVRHLPPGRTLIAAVRTAKRSIARRRA